MKSNQVDQKYNPTAEDNERTKLDPEKFLLSGDGVFHTIQGEGKFLGRPATFIRLHHCNLQCSFCDTWYTWRKDTKEFWQEPYKVNNLQLAEAISKAQTDKNVADPVHHLVFTGGEPMLHQDQIFKFLMEYHDFSCEIETNGTLPPENLLAQLTQYKRVHFNVSPKISNSDNDYVKSIKFDTLKLYARLGSSFKFVVKSITDVEEIEKLILNKVDIPKRNLWFMPEGDNLTETNRHTLAIRDYLIQNSYNITPRFQLFLYPNKQRAV